MSDHIIVTRHPALVRYIQENGIAPKGTPVIPHAKPRDVIGKHVYGVIPLRLAHLARSVTEVPIMREACDAKAEITYDRFCQIALPPVVLRAEVISGTYSHPYSGEGECDV